MHLLTASVILQHFGDLLVVMCMVGMAIFGWQQGLFLATLAGLQVLGSCMLALACASRLAAVLIGAECPAHLALPLSFLVIFLGGVVVTRLAIGAAVPEDAVRFPSPIDRFGGTCIGILAGVALAGGLLIAWSMAELPEGFAVRPTELVIDPGSKMIHTYARCSDEEGLADRLVRCYDACDWKTPVAPPPAAAGPGVPADVPPATQATTDQPPPQPATGQPTAEPPAGAPAVANP